MPHDPILHLLGLAKKAGRLEIGEEPVGAAARAHQARVLLLAADAAPNTVRRAAHFGEAGGALWLQMPFTKAELGEQLGRSSCAMLAVTDFGFAAALAEKLAARDEERYGPAAQQLRAKADRALMRQREKRQHEKNMRQGKHKPWAAQPSRPSKREEAPPTTSRRERGKGGSGRRPGSFPRKSREMAPSGDLTTRISSFFGLISRQPTHWRIGSFLGTVRTTLRRIRN